MPLRIPFGTLALLACALAIGSVDAGSPQPQTAGGQRIVAIGDIHGAAAELTQILQLAGLIDDKQRWSGGQTRVVQTGDFTDRGADVRAVMDLLMRLEGEARRAGGRVDVLFGNHEGMNLMREFRDVSPRAYAAFADRRSDERRNKAFEVHAEIAKRAGTTLSRDQWMAARPLGFIEYVQAFAPRGQYGRWIRGRKAMLQIDDTIFMHAGLQPQSMTTLEEVNRAVERDVRTWDELVATLERHKLASTAYTSQELVDVVQVEIGRLVVAQKTGEPVAEHVTPEYVKLLQSFQGIAKWTLIDGEGPLWYRGLATANEEGLAGLDGLLSKLGARRFVIGHTPQLPARIVARLSGRVVLIDTGMLSSHYKDGQPSALEIHNGRLTAIYAKGREEIGALSR